MKLLGLQKSFGRKTLKVVTSPRGKNYRRIVDSIRVVNFLQNYFRCEMVQEDKLLSGQKKEIAGEALAARIAKSLKDEAGLVLTEEFYASGVLVEEHLSLNVIIASCADWAVAEPPPRRLFILYQIAGALITFEARLDELGNEELIHRPPVGCLFDWWEGEEEWARSFLAARLCPKCLRRLRLDEGVSVSALNAVQRILDYIRRVNLEGDDKVPSKIFIAHGHEETWKQLREMIRDFGLEVVEFNEQEQSGLITTTRWVEMLAETCFAFAFLTPQEIDGSGQWLPSLNVIHEIGLCHARLGFERTVILRSGAIREFSNITGVTCLTYDPDKFHELRERIHQILIERGIL